MDYLLIFHISLSLFHSDCYSVCEKRLCHLLLWREISTVKQSFTFFLCIFLSLSLRSEVFHLVSVLKRSFEEAVGVEWKTLLSCIMGADLQKSLTRARLGKMLEYLSLTQISIFHTIFRYHVENNPTLRT